MLYLDIAKQVIDCEIRALQNTRDFLNDSFERLVFDVKICSGRIVVTGMGKSGHICRKIVATMQSLGIKAYFMHPAEGLHGDLGILSDQDLVIAFSNSGETDEVLALIPSIRRIGARLFCVIGRENSTLEKLADDSVVLCNVEEAYMGNIVPTSSTTAALAFGDALAVAIASANKFEEHEFAVYHPNGMLGRRLTLTAQAIMINGNENAVIEHGSTVEQAIFEMCRTPIGGVNVVDPEGNLKGVFTDGDLRRLIHRYPQNALLIKIDEVMTTEPMRIEKDMLVADIVKEMDLQGKKISFFPVVEGNKLVGSLRLLDISRAGLLG